jgi:hypothetical protein
MITRRILTLQFRTLGFRLPLAIVLCLVSALLAVASLGASSFTKKSGSKKSKHSPVAFVPASQTAFGGWSWVDSPNTTEQQLLGVSCISSSDCWSVGYYVNELAYHQTLIEHWNGSSWTIVPSPNVSSSQNGFFDNFLESVTCTSASNCWAAGYSQSSTTAPATLLEHWDGTSWSIVSSPNIGSSRNRLFGVTCTSASDCWAVGDYKNTTGSPHTLIEHWDGSSWSMISSPNTSATRTNFLSSVTCASSSDCWVAGHAFNSNNTANQTLVEHWDGNAWSIVASPNTDGAKDNVLTDTTCASATDCWAVGYYDGGNVDADGVPIYQTLIERWNGANWSIVASPNTSATQTNYLLGVSCASSSQCHAVGYAFDSTSAQTVIEQWNGTSWSLATSPTSSTTQFRYLNAVNCVPSSQCWAVGYSDYQHVLTERWSGSIWSIVASPSAAGGGSANYLRGVICNSNVDCWAVGQNSVGDSYIQHWNGSSWSQFFVPFTAPRFHSLDDVTCVAATDCWAAGHFYDSSDNSQTLTEHWDGNSWTEIASPSTGGTEDDFLEDVTCTSSSDCWVVGTAYDYSANSSRTLVEHWNGSSWSIIPSPSGPYSGDGAMNELSGVSCSSASDCWAVGFSGNRNTGPIQTLIEHWNGSAWTIVASPNPSVSDNVLYGLTCTSSSNCWAVGNYNPDGNSHQALIEHWDGNSWSIVSAPVGPPENHYLEDVTCSSSSDCWAVGNSDNYPATVTIHWDGGSWSVVGAAGAPYALLHAVTCSSAGNCWTVGEFHNQALTPFPTQNLIEKFTKPPLIVSAHRNPNGHFVLTGQTEPNMSIDIQASPDLVAPFVTIDTVTTDATGAFQYDDANASNYQKRFYRAAVP